MECTFAHLRSQQYCLGGLTGCVLDLSTNTLPLITLNITSPLFIPNLAFCSYCSIVYRHNSLREINEIDGERPPRPPPSLSEGGELSTPLILMYIAPASNKRLGDVYLLEMFHNSSLSDPIMGSKAQCNIPLPKLEQINTPINPYSLPGSIFSSSALSLQLFCSLALINKCT